MKSSNLFSTLGLIAINLVLAVGCTTKVDDKLLERTGTDREIYSLRPQSDQFIAIVKLNGDPLLLRVQTAQDGKKSIPAEALAEINAEQTAFLNALHQVISPDIKVLYTYKYVVNGFAILAPRSVEEKLKALTNVAYVEWSNSIARPTIAANPHVGDANNDYTDANSVKWIGSEQVHQLLAKKADGSTVAVKGKGVKVGIIDTGIDYTHSMLGGVGSADLFKSTDPSKPSDAFPNAKVIGGIDLVGTAYDSASADFAKHIPLPDVNPLDEGGHGTHVAGTVAGIGDGKNTYSGVAPDADLFAIKVFGKDGSTSDSVIVAALEYAANPENLQDGSLAPLDVVNLSLGGGFGNPKSLYEEAVRNLSSAGTVVVCAAGNSGAVDYIVGAPSTSDEAISVAASIDNAKHNWQFGAVKLSSANLGDVLTEAIEAAITKPIKEAGDVRGELVYLGIGDEELTDAQKASVKGKVAFFDRGKINFGVKIKRGVDLGAIGVVVGNNAPGNAFTMGGEGKFEIPAVMISLDLASQAKKEIEAGNPVTIAFQTPEKIEKPELIDTLTDFSSKGPRSTDAAIKPEISAPGNDVVSAAMGEGDKGVRFSGTSMATPHMAGVMALLRQYRPELSVAQLKSIVMNTSKSLSTSEKAVYPVSLQGAGRVQAYEAATATVAFTKSSLSLGLLNVEKKRTVRQLVGIKNLSDKEQAFSLEFAQAPEGITLLTRGSFALPAKAEANLVLDFEIDSSKVKTNVVELDGHVLFKSAERTYTIPVLGVISKVSNIQATSLIVGSSSASDAAGAAAQVALENKGAHEGGAWLFNLLARDDRKADKFNSGLLKACDLQVAGYRIIEKDIMGERTKALQIAYKLYSPMTTWNTCEVNVQLDANGDGVADQELAGTQLENLGAQVPQLPGMFFSVLLDAGKARELRAQLEAETKAGKEPQVAFAQAIQAVSFMIGADRSTVAILEADIRKLAKNKNGTLSVKISTSFGETSAIEMDDYLDQSAEKWSQISVDENAQSFMAMPEVVTLKAGQKEVVPLIKGQGKSNLLVLMPQNAFVLSDKDVDSQSKVLKATYYK